MEANELTSSLDRLREGLESYVDKGIQPLAEAMQKNQTFIDELAKMKKFSGSGNIYTGAPKSFDEAFSEALAVQYNAKQNDVQALQRDKNAKFSFQIKQPVTMTVGGSLT